MALHISRRLIWRFNVRNRRRLSSVEIRSAEEIEIPVPFGHLSAKVFGPGDGQPVLALHGWQDNAGTFDPLIQHLDPSFRIVAVDLPGHGLSSQLPPGGAYHYTENLLYMKMVLNHLKWTRCSLLGHSMGGGLSLLFAAVFPDSVQSVVSLDIMKLFRCDHTELICETRNSVERLVETFVKMVRPKPVYSPEEAASRLVRGSFMPLSRVAAQVLLRRGSAPSEDGRGVSFTRDIRLQCLGIQKVDEDSCKTYLGGLRCNLLVVKAVPGFQLETSDTLQAYHEMYSRNCSRYFYRELEGNHHVHIDNPKPVADLLNCFLLKRYSEL